MRRTYYDVLGVPRNASLEEITNAKNALAKIYHPDANISAGIDTTAYMQEILEAYRTLSNPEKREKYDLKLMGGKHRNFKTFDLSEADDSSEISFVSYWNAALKLNGIIVKSAAIFKKESENKRLIDKIRLKLGMEVTLRPAATEKLNKLATEAVKCISTLRSANISVKHWHKDAMNWVLIRWGQKQTYSYDILFSKYDAYVEESMSAKDRNKLNLEIKHMQQDLKKLLKFTVI